MSENVGTILVKKYLCFSKWKSKHNKVLPHTSQKGHNLKKKKSTNNKSWKWCREKGTFLYCLWECKLIQPLWRTIWKFFGKLGINLPRDPKIPLLGIYTEKTTTLKHTCTPVFIAAWFTIARTWKQPSIHWQINE